MTLSGHYALCFEIHASFGTHCKNLYEDRRAHTVVGKAVAKLPTHSGKFNYCGTAQHAIRVLRKSRHTMCDSLLQTVYRTLSSSANFYTVSGKKEAMH